MAGRPRNSRRGGSRPWLGPRVPLCGSGPEMLQASLPALSAPLSPASSSQGPPCAQGHMVQGPEGLPCLDGSQHGGPGG